MISEIEFKHFVRLGHHYQAFGVVLSHHLNLSSTFYRLFSPYKRAHRDLAVIMLLLSSFCLRNILYYVEYKAHNQLILFRSDDKINLQRYMQLYNNFS